MYSIKYGYVLAILILSLTSIGAQDGIITVKDVIITGNTKTKEKIILRELNFEEGTNIKLDELEDLFTLNRYQILSTGLFNEVVLNLRNYNTANQTADIEVSVEENWYLFPLPIFELADRNFSVWWEEQGRSLNRVNYGFRIGHQNFSGNRDPLKVKIHFGYTRKYEVEYEYPYLAWDNTLGIGGSVFYSENREIAFQTIGNKTQFRRLEDERRLLSRFRIGPQIKYRPNIYSNHSLVLQYHHNTIDPFVSTELNPNYFLEGQTRLRFFILDYSFNYDRRVFSVYPRGGHLIFAKIKKEGLGLFNTYNNLSFEAGFEIHKSIKDRIIFGTRTLGKTNLDRSVVSFANNTGLGWGTDIVSGYELYVLDGTDYVISQNDAKWKFYDRNHYTAKWLPEQLRKMNVTIFFRVNFDFAYVNERTYADTNDLNNRWIYGGGPAIDLILFNNYLFRFEYSFNDIGEQGLFFHNTFAF